MRAATVIFIDDNALNRAEACALIADLQVADPSLLLLDPACRGKDDRDLTRLAPYKLFERRHGELSRDGADNETFLRNSHIRVSINPDIESRLDRAVELINRTHQKLGRPELSVVGEVVAETTQAASLRLGKLRCCGGCELESLAHYFRVHADAVLQETNRQRGPFFVHLNCTPMVLLASGREPPAAHLRKLGFADADIRSGFLAPAAPGSLLIYSGWGDLTCDFLLIAARAPGSPFPSSASISNR